MNDVVKQLVDNNRENILARLPRYMTPEQFFSFCYNLSRNAGLARVAQNNPESLLNAIMKAAELGLVIGGAYEHCWVIPYKEEAQLQIGWQGMRYLLMRSGAIVKLAAACVYEGDEFNIELGDKEALIHRPMLNDDRRRDPKWMFDKRNIRGAYAVAWLPTGLTAHRWCEMGEIEAARLKSKVPDGPAWTHFYPAMASKTPVRRLGKLIDNCGPTPENLEAWERYGRVLEVERSQYHNLDDIPKLAATDDMPKAKKDRRAGGTPAGTERVESSPPQDGDRKTKAPERSAAPIPPPIQTTARKVPDPKPAEPEEPISLERQDQIMDRVNAAGIKATAILEFIRSEFGIAGLGVTPSQATKIDQYIREHAS
jgi:phage RecT family recombinase